MNAPTLTFYTTPKPFEGHIGIIQRNALRSWARLPNAPRILLFGDEPGIAEIAAEIGAEHVPEIERNEWGTPLLNALMRDSEKISDSPYLCYVNADIILMSDFAAAFEQTRSQIKRFLLSGRRWNLDVTSPLDFNGAWENKLREHALDEGHLYLTGAIDYFCYPRGLWEDIPPFAIGRTVWDNWLLWKARSSKAALVDATQSVVAVHQNHSYAHHAGGRQGVFHGDEAQRNFALTGGEAHHYTLNVATHHLVRGQLMRRRPGRWMLERVQTSWTGLSRGYMRRLAAATERGGAAGLLAGAVLNLFGRTAPLRGRFGKKITQWRDRA